MYCTCNHDPDQAAATRKAPGITTAFLAKAQQCIGRWTSHHTQAMKLLWHIWATITPVLWRLRNKAVFEGKIKSEQETQAAMIAAGSYQVQAIASAWKKNPATNILGLCLGICHSIMQTVNTNDAKPTLDTWNMQYCSKQDKHGQVRGGWVLYHHRQDAKWHPVRAGSIHFPKTESNIDDAARVLEQGITEMLTITQPSTVYLRIATLDKKLQDHVQADEVKSGRLSEEVASLMNKLHQIFSIQWGNPTGTAYKAAKLMSTLQQNKIFDIQGTGQATSPSTHVRKSIMTSSPEKLVSPPRQTNDIVSRLIAYQASIGK